MRGKEVHCWSEDFVSTTKSADWMDHILSFRYSTFFQLPTSHHSFISSLGE